MALDRLHVAADVHALRPDFAVLALAVIGLTNGPSDAQSETWLHDAEAHTRATGTDLPAHVLAWQDTFRAFGAKPQRTASSVEALWRRAAGAGLPRVNWLVDLYNAVSVRHTLPVGGVDLSLEAGEAAVFRADRPHRYAAAGGRATRFVMVVMEPIAPPADRPTRRPSARPGAAPRAARIPARGTAPRAAGARPR